MNNFYTLEELEAIGFNSIGSNVLLSRKASIYSPESISIGNNTRIDDFTIISGKITIGRYVHISAGTYLFAGDEEIEIQDYAGISSRCAIYAITDDYLGLGMSGPMVPREFRHITGGKVTIGKHALIGTGCTILPNLTVGEGASVAAMSLVNKNLEPWHLYYKVSEMKCERKRERILEYERALEEWSHDET